MTSATSPSTFNELGLIPELLARLTDLEYTQPTPIQAKAIPSVLAGSDLIAGAIQAQVKQQRLRCQCYKKCSLNKVVKRSQQR